MRVITLAGSPRFPSRSSSLLEYAREKLNGLDVEVYHWNLQNFAPEDLLYARFDSPALNTFTEQLQQADGLIVATPVYKDPARPAARTCVARQSGATAGDGRYGGPSAGGRLCP